MSVSRKLFLELLAQSRLSLLAALLAVLMTSPLPAQIVETGVITGVVRDTAGSVVVKANVAIVNAGTGLASHTATDSQGLYVSPPLNPADYNVEVEAPSSRSFPTSRQRLARYGPPKVEATEVFRQLINACLCDALH